VSQADVLGPLDGWLAGKFGRGHLDDTIDELAAAAALPSDADAGQDELRSKIAACDRKLAQYRAALDAGADPATVAGWITETEAARATFVALQRPARQKPQATRDEIAAIVTSLSDLHAVVRDASPSDKAEIYKQLGLRLTYQPGQRIVQAQAALSEGRYWAIESVRGGTDPVSPHCSISYNADIDLPQTDGRMPL
jgi:hypothetical protein